MLERLRAHIEKKCPGTPHKLVEQKVMGGVGGLMGFATQLVLIATVFQRAPEIPPHNVDYYLTTHLIHFGVNSIVFCSLGFVAVQRDIKWARRLVWFYLIYSPLLSNLRNHCKMFSIAGTSELSFIAILIAGSLIIGTPIKTATWLYLYQFAIYMAMMAYDFTDGQPCFWDWRDTTLPETKPVFTAIIVLLATIVLALLFNMTFNDVHERQRQQEELVEIMKEVAGHISNMQLEEAQRAISVRDPTLKGDGELLYSHLGKVIDILQEYRPYIADSAFVHGGEDDTRSETCSDGAGAEEEAQLPGSAPEEKEPDEDTPTQPCTQGQRTEPDPRAQTYADSSAGSEARTKRQAKLEAGVHKSRAVLVCVALRPADMCYPTPLMKQMGGRCATPSTPMAGQASITKEVVPSEMLKFSETFVKTLFEVVAEHKASVYRFSGCAAVVSLNCIRRQGGAAVSAANCALDLQATLKKALGETVGGFDATGALCQPPVPGISIIQASSLCGNIGDQMHKTFHIEPSLVAFGEALAAFNAQIGTGILCSPSITSAIGSHSHFTRPAERILVKNTSMTILCKGVQKHQASPAAANKSYFTLNRNGASQDAMTISEILSARSGLQEEEWMYQLQEAEGQSGQKSLDAYVVAFRKLHEGDPKAAETAFTLLSQLPHGRTAPPEKKDGGSDPEDPDEEAAKLMVDLPPTPKNIDWPVERLLKLSADLSARSVTLPPTRAVSCGGGWELFTGESHLFPNLVLR